MSVLSGPDGIIQEKEQSSSGVNIQGFCPHGGEAEPKERVSVKTRDNPMMSGSLWSHGGHTALVDASKLPCCIFCSALLCLIVESFLFDIVAKIIPVTSLLSLGFPCLRC